MISDDVNIDGLAGTARLRLPEQRKPGRALVTLHGAELGDADQPLFKHLGETATQLGYAVVSYDRRSTASGDVPFRHQADDALTALRWVGSELDVPVGLFGFSQGAWAAALAAAQDPRVAELVLVGCSGVSPALQMRYFTDEALRRQGFNAADRTELLEVRTAVEDVLRGAGDRERAERLLARANTRRWFDLAYLPHDLPAPDHRWEDMDYDPAPTFARVTCPTLLLYGQHEECVPASESKAAWRATSPAVDLTVADVPGCGHFPSALGHGQQLVDVSPAYTALLTDWLDRQARGSARPHMPSASR